MTVGLKVKMFCVHDNSLEIALTYCNFTEMFFTSKSQVNSMSDPLELLNEVQIRSNSLVCVEVDIV